VLDAARKQQSLRRFVNISSLAVYSNSNKRHGRLLDESCPLETKPERRGDAYCFAKVKQDELVAEYATKHGVPCVTLRPGYVFGPAKSGISSRIGIGTFGLFLHLGGGNQIPLTYVDNCAEAIAQAGLRPGLENEVFNVVDDDLPTSRQFLKMYKRQVSPFASVYVPHVISYALCYLWERYSHWSEGQLPPVFNRLHWHAYLKRTHYSNTKLKTRVGWTPRIPMDVGLQHFFEASRRGSANA
jgi:nucleoside-diphosphate-sugar epimerase